MKSLRLVCRTCSTPWLVRGRDVEDIIRQIEIGGWQDLPSPDVPKSEHWIWAVCPPCQETEAREART